MKAKEWRQRYDKCSTLDEMVDFLSSYVEETVDLAKKRKSGCKSAILEQRQKWLAMKLPVELFEIVLDFQFPKFALKHFENHAELIAKLLPDKLWNETLTSSQLPDTTWD